MGFVGFDLERFPVKAKLEPKRRRKRPLVHCKCSDWYESGTYATHVRHSTHSSHDKDHGIHVDMQGNVTRL